MVNLFDSHAHLDDEMFDADREQVIENIKNSGVKLVTNIASSIKTSYQSVDLAEKYDFIYATAGVHPSDVYDMTDSDLDTIEKLSMHKKVVAIGEIGLDYHYDGYDENLQKHWFLKQLKLAEKLDMPVVVHSRDAAKDTMDILKSVNTKGIIHCYSGSAEMAKEYIDMGYYISFTGTVTYKNAKTAVKV
ncbi:MAG: TatD family hydrolase, partial [Clostridia bacterium]|nr:TatD family hydrolase [Clostridia bacterium]